MIATWAAILIAFGAAVGGFFFKSWTTAWLGGVKQGTFESDLRHIKIGLNELTLAVGASNAQQKKVYEDLSRDFYNFKYRVCLKLQIPYE